MKYNYVEREKAKDLAKYYKQDHCVKNSLKSLGLTINSITWQFIIEAGVTNKDQSDKITPLLKQKKKQMELKKKELEHEKQKNILNSLLSSPIEVLCLDPKFNMWVKGVRSKYGINTKILKTERIELFKNKDANFIKAVHSRLDTDCDVWKIYKYEHAKIEKYATLLGLLERVSEKELIHSLNQDISWIRFKYMKLPSRFNKILRNYILYDEKLGFMASVIKKSRPSAKFEFDEKNCESYISIKIYADTEKKELDKIWQQKINKMQKIITEITPPSTIFKKKYSVFVRQLLWCRFRLGQKMTPEESNIALKKCGFKPVNYKKSDDKKVQRRYLETLYK